MKQHPILFSTAMVQAILAGSKTQTRRIIKTPAGVTGFMECPFGGINDILWVRETWCIIPHGPDSFGPYLYKSMGDEPYGKWKPSIHMPKSACRLYLQITDIRVERLNDISEEDARAEGILSYNDSALGMRYKDYMADASGYGDPDHDYPTTGDPIASFGTLWGSINGPDSWRANPFVWVISFKKIDKPS